MGNNIKKGDISNLHDNWVTANQPTSQILNHTNLYRTRLLINTTTHDYIEQYIVHHINEQDFRKYLKETQWRQGLEHRQPSAYIPPIRAFINTSSSEICTKSFTANIYFDKIQMRLTQINDIPFLDALYMLRVCLEGFKLLMQHFGCFNICEDQIFINSQGQVKVWIHPNLSVVSCTKDEAYYPQKRKSGLLKNSKSPPNTLNYEIKKGIKLGNPKQAVMIQRLHQSFGSHSFQNSYLKQEHSSAQSQEAMINQIINMIESNIDRDTLQGTPFFSEYATEKIKGKSSTTGYETTRNRAHRSQNMERPGYRPNGQYNVYTYENPSANYRKPIPGKPYGFRNMLDIYQEYVQQFELKIPIRMEVIHSIYKNKFVQENPNILTPNFLSKNESTGQKDKSFSSSGHEPLIFQFQNTQPTKFNQRTAHARTESEVSPPTDAKWNHIKSYFRGNFDQSAVTHINPGTANGLINFNSEGSIKKKSNFYNNGRLRSETEVKQANNSTSFNVIQYNSDENLKQILYSNSNVINFLSKSPKNNQQILIEESNVRQINNRKYQGPPTVNSFRGAGEQRPMGNKIYTLNEAAGNANGIKLMHKSGDNFLERSKDMREMAQQDSYTIVKRELRNNSMDNKGKNSGYTNANNFHSHLIENHQNYNNFSQPYSNNQMSTLHQSCKINPIFSDIRVDPNPYNYHNHNGQTGNKYHSPLSTLVEQKNQYGNKITRTNQANPRANNMNTKVINNIISRQSNRQSPLSGHAKVVGGFHKNSEINNEGKQAAISNLNAIKYLKTPQVIINPNFRNPLEREPQMLANKPSSVSYAVLGGIRSSNPYSPINNNVGQNEINKIANVQKYIRQNINMKGMGELNKNICTSPLPISANNPQIAAQVNINYNTKTVSRKSNGAQVQANKKLITIEADKKQIKRIGKSELQEYAGTSNRVKTINLASTSRNANKLSPTSETYKSEVLTPKNKQTVKNKYSSRQKELASRKDMKYYTQNEIYEVDSQIAGDLMEIREQQIHNQYGLIQMSKRR